jgi:DNA replication protein DnaC
MISEIRQLLCTLKLRGIDERLDSILEEAEQQGSSTQEVLLKILREEFRERQERSIESRLRKAKIPEKWSLDTFPFDQQPSINKLQVTNLANLSFIGRRENIVLIGDPGTGKSGIAMSLLRQAVVNGHRGLFYDAQKLLNDLYSSLADKSTTRLIKMLSSIDLLVVDELGYLNLNNDQCNAFFKLMSLRYNKKPTIITTNLEYPQWYELFKQKSLVDAMLDRLHHHCITIHIEGPTLRTPSEEKIKQINKKKKISGSSNKE